MQDVMSAIRERRSIRNFESTDVPEDQLQQVLEAAQWSPSWSNTQCWEIVVVKEQAMKEKLKATLPGGNPASKSFDSAPVVLALCAKMGITGLGLPGYHKGETATKFGDWFMFDVGIAAQNIGLAAHGLGLGSVIVGLFDHDKAKEALKVPEGYEVVAFMPLGYPSKVPSPPKRKTQEEFVHKETF